MSASAGAVKYRQGLMFAGLLLVALLPRLYSAQTLGWDWDHPGSFTLINFDEGGSCRAALDGFSYSSFVGRQTIGLASAIGLPPPEGIAGDQRAVKAYCHSAGHILVARTYSAVLGSLTVLLLAWLGMQLVPAKPTVGWTAAGLLALSGFHISQSQSGTVDAPSTFFIYLFVNILVWSIRKRHTFGFALSPLFLLFAVWTKYWVFATFAYLSLLPHVGWQWLSAGFSRWRMVLLVLSMSVWLAAITNVDFPRLALALPLAIYGLVVPWRQLDWPQRMLWILLPAALWALTRVDLINAYTTSGEGGRFGSGYAAIGANKWLRNLVNVPAVVVVGIGLPATLFIGLGVKKMLGDVERARLWLCLLPILAFLLFMAFLAPVTYYRHYLPLIPAACLLAAVGLHATSLGRRSWFVALFMLWPALLALDLVSDYHRDPRLALRPWFAEHPQAAVFTSFYVSPPPGTRTALFRPEFAQGDGATLKQADYLILSENWYDTAYANELNGPRVNDLEKLIKTTPEYTRFYRQVLAGQHPLLLPSAEMNLPHFMPELMLHRYWYGSFQLFVGDLRIFRVSK